MRNTASRVGAKMWSGDLRHVHQRLLTVFMSNNRICRRYAQGQILFSSSFSLRYSFHPLILFAPALRELGRVVPIILYGTYVTDMYRQNEETSEILLENIYWKRVHLLIYIVWYTRFRLTRLGIMYHFLIYVVLVFSLTLFITWSVRGNMADVCVTLKRTEAARIYLRAAVVY
jgi:hypothetical protein